MRENGDMHRFLLTSMAVAALVLWYPSTTNAAEATLPKEVAQYEDLLSGDYADAKAWLKTKVDAENRTSCSGHPFETDESIDKLNPAFALCAARFLQAYENVYSAPIVISSAYRSRTQQKCVCPVAEKNQCGGIGHIDDDGQLVGGSNHIRGLAIDINTGNYKEIHEFANTNSEAFGVHFPLVADDRVHMQPVSKDDPKCVTQEHRTVIPKWDTDVEQEGPVDYTPAPITYDYYYYRQPGTSIGEALASSLLMQQATYQSFGSNSTTPIPASFSPGDPYYSGSSNTETESNTSFLNESGASPFSIDFGKTEESSQTQSPISSGTGNTSVKTTCEGSGLFGINLFSTCGTPSSPQATFTQDSATTNTTFEQSPVQRAVNAISRVLQTDSNNYVYDDTTDQVQRVSTHGGSVDVFYGVHQAQDGTSAQPQQGSGLQYGQFVAGEREQVAPENREASPVLEDSLKIAQKGFEYGMYYGLVHGVSPFVIGSAPRTLVRFVSSLQNASTRQRTSPQELDGLSRSAIDIAFPELKPEISFVSSGAVAPVIPEDATYEEGVRILVETARTNTENEYVYAYVTKDGVGRWVFLSTLGPKGGTFEPAPAYKDNPDLVVLLHTHPSVGLSGNPPSLQDMSSALPSRAGIPTRYGAVDNNGVWEYAQIGTEGKNLSVLLGAIEKVNTAHPKWAPFFLQKVGEYGQANPEVHPSNFQQLVIDRAIAGEYGSDMQIAASEFQKALQELLPVTDLYLQIMNRFRSSDPQVIERGIEEIINFYQEFGYVVTPPPVVGGTPL